METTATRVPSSAASSPELAAVRPPVISEDWLAVIVGGTLIALALADARPSNPIQIAVLVLAPLIAGAAVLGAGWRDFSPAQS